MHIAPIIRHLTSLPLPHSVPPALLALLVAASSACASSAPDPEPLAEDEGELRALSSAEIVGTLTPGETKLVAYTKAPLYRALKLELAAGQQVDLAVRSATGDARAWLLGPSFQTLALSTDVSDTDTSARIERRVSRAGTYYIAFREEKLKDASFQVSLAGAVSPPAADRCTSDAECGGGAAMCFIDRCVSVSDEARTIPGLSSGAVAAYSRGDQLQVAYTVFQRSSGNVSNEENVHHGPWGGATVTNGASSATMFRFDEAPGLEPAFALSGHGYTGDAVSFDGSGTKVDYRERIHAFAVGRNQAGTQFIALVASARAPASGGLGACTLRFASRPAGGAWSAHQIVDACPSSTYRSLAIHVRRDGGADIVASADFGAIVRYSRSNPIDPWSKAVLIPANGTQGQSAFAFAHGRDGTTHLAAQPYEHVTSSSNGDYTASYVELGDEGIVRQVPLGTYREQFIPPFGDVGVDAAGNVWLLKRAREMGDRAAVVRIDGRGEAVERSVGLLPPRSNVSTALAIAPSGEIAVLATVNYTMTLRRFTPAGR